MSMLLMMLAVLVQDPPPAAAAAPEDQMGVVTLNCALKPSGYLEDCRIVSETPADQGFGPAALRLSREMRVPLRDGQTEHAPTRVQFNTRFQLDPLDVVVALPDRR